jgi:menaquinone-dependent protoporphyrinogen oxidase
MTARVLVAFASKMGSTAEIAESIAATLRAAGLDATAQSARVVTDLTAFDAVILGSALYAAHWQRDANRFVAHHLAALQDRPLWLFSSGPLDSRLAAANLPIAPQAAEVTAALTPRGHRTFGGRLDPDAPGLDPQILATHPIGDFRDWTVITDWAASIAVELLESG